MCINEKVLNSVVDLARARTEEDIALAHERIIDNLLHAIDVKSYELCDTMEQNRIMMDTMQNDMKRQESTKNNKKQ